MRVGTWTSRRRRSPTRCSSTATTRVAELYGVVNVPTTVWIDEDGRIARPPSIAPADDKFKDFTQIDSAVHHDALLRRWVRDDVAPLDARRGPGPPRRTDRGAAAGAAPSGGSAMHLLRAGHEDGRKPHLAHALRAARRRTGRSTGARCRCVGMDPFGQDFFDFYERGRTPAVRATAPTDGVGAR